MNINPIGHLVKTKPIQTQFKANSNPIKPNLPDAQMSVTSILTKDYEINDFFAVPENKANSKPISVKAKMNANTFSQKDYENETTLRLKQNKPNQSRGIKRVRSIFRRFILAFLTQALHINITTPIYDSKTRICPQNQKKT